jgi:hypothetical protein
MKQHLAKYFGRAAEHHLTKAKHHHGMAKAVATFRGSLHKSADVSDVDTAALDALLEHFIESHSAIGDEHVDMGEHCAQCAKTFSASGKSMLADELAPLPEGLSTISPDAPRGQMVLRPGMREPATSHAVEKLFEKIVSVD